VLLRPVSAQVSNQSFQVTPEVDRATVGDPVTLRFRVRLDERDLLFDTIPQPVAALPAGVRVLSVDKLARSPDRIFYGRARVAFYRTGRRAVPVFGLPFMRAVKGLQRGTLASDSAFVEIASLVPAGNPSLKDIREIELVAPWSPWPLVGAATAALLLLAGYLRRRRRPAPVPPLVDTAPAHVRLRLSSSAGSRAPTGRSTATWLDTTRRPSTSFAATSRPRNSSPPGSAPPRSWSGPSLRI